MRVNFFIAFWGDERKAKNFFSVWNWDDVLISGYVVLWINVQCFDDLILIVYRIVA